MTVRVIERQKRYGERQRETHTQRKRETEKELGHFR